MFGFLLHYIFYLSYYLILNVDCFFQATAVLHLLRFHLQFLEYDINKIEKNSSLLKEKNQQNQNSTLSFLATGFGFEQIQ